MKCAYITHPACFQHDNGSGHPESPGRLTAIYQHLKASPVYEDLLFYEAPLATHQQLQRVHSKSYIESIEKKAPREGGSVVYLDPDTRLSVHTLEAARRAAGAVVLASDLVMDGRLDHVFCALKPPGHHAKHDQAMCLRHNFQGKIC